MAAQTYTATCSVGTTTDHRTACQAARITDDGGIVVAGDRDPDAAAAAVPNNPSLLMAVPY